MTDEKERLELNRQLALGRLLEAVEQVVAMEQHDRKHEILAGTLQAYYTSWREQVSWALGKS